MNSSRKVIVVFAAAVALSLAPAALADATTSVYDGAAKSTQNTIGKTTQVKGEKVVVKSTSAKPTAATLPFTGMDLGFVALGGAMLAGMGYSLRRLARDTDR